jgi:hypothetical protein
VSRLPASKAPVEAAADAVILHVAGKLPVVGGAERGVRSDLEVEPASSSAASRAMVTPETVKPALTGNF